MTIRIADTINDSIVDGPGLRFSIFAQGCPHKCKGCHNPHTHDFDKGYDVSIEHLLSKIEENPLLSGVTFTGGEPFMQPVPFAALAKKVKELDLNVIAYTGYAWEELITKEECLELLKYTDFLVDGLFDETKKSLGLRFRGSKNQRIIDVKESFEQNTVVTVEW